MNEKDTQLIQELLALGKANVETAKEHWEEKKHSRILNIVLVISLLVTFLFGYAMFCENEKGWREYLSQYDYSTESYSADATGNGIAAIGGEGDVTIGAGEKGSSEANAEKPQ